MTEFVLSEVKKITNMIIKEDKLKKDFEIIIYDNGNPLENFLISCFNDIRRFRNINITVLNGNNFSDYNNNKAGEKIVFTFLNFNLPIYDENEKCELEYEKIKKLLELSKRQNVSQFFFISNLRMQHAHPKPYQRITEEEYNTIYDKYPEDSIEHIHLKFERLCDEYKTNFMLKIIRFDNIIGPGINGLENIGIDKMCSDIIFRSKLEVSKKDTHNFYNLCYIYDAMVFLLYMIDEKKKGIFNGPGVSFSRFYIAMLLYEIVSHTKEIELTLNDTEQEERKYYGLRNTRDNIWKAISPIRKSLENTISSVEEKKFGKEIFYKTIEKKYDGKLTRIRELELLILKEIDRICKKHDIKYFLVGGSLLGAIRHKGFIPWDDDLDIGMLRKDYELFRKVAPKELKSFLSYQSYRTEKKSHYIFDKIRLNNTIFATKFSYLFDIHNGIFVDVLVYDKTSRFKVIQKLHILFVRIWTILINIRWKEKPNVSCYSLSRILLPLIKLFPFGFYHWFFERTLRLFRFSKSKYLIDGVGQNIMRGAFRSDFFDEIKTVEFEDMMVPVPEKYDEYLKHWYGKSYMEFPPLYQRNSGHAIANMDLGNYLDDLEFDALKKELEG